MNIVCSTLGARRPPAEARAVRGARAALRHGRTRGGELHIVWTTRARLRILNRRFRQKNRFTDVIAFRYPAERGRSPFDGPAAGAPFGDLYIATDQARLNARRFGSTRDEEIVRLATHGTLHLLGYTDYEPAPRARMWAVQEPIVRRIMGVRSR